VIQGKTAALFAAACQIGAVVADRPEPEEQALSDFGLYIGTAFQLVDDALDYAADQAELGKTVGDDFREGKITGPVLVAYKAGNELDRAFWRRTIEQSEQTDADLDHALLLMAQTGAIESTLQRAKDFAARAKAALAVFPDSRVKTCLADAADYTVRRPLQVQKIHRRCLARHPFREHGLSHAHANHIAKRAAETAAPRSSDDPVAHLFAGKAALRPLHDRLTERITVFGPDVEFAPKKAKVSVRRRRQFALLQPSTATQMDVGLILQRPPAGRLEPSGSFNAMFTHRIKLAVLADIDDQVVAWLKEAYDAAQ
jgi:hypothetical protein